jgi:hypothetical protein
MTPAIVLGRSCSASGAAATEASAKRSSTGGLRLLPAIMRGSVAAPSAGLHNRRSMHESAPYDARAIA